ncbi:MAG TPA: biopolymer transporter ExbD [Caulobacteraceae bacterium]|jgi:biopolymer transport protein ExbD|nr:biopolymer transporter ExbD [Caulobacteraceae bacterium]
MSGHLAAQLGGRTAARRFSLSQNHEINVTPFVDVLLVLLIVFMIAAPLATTAIDIDIAAGGGGPMLTPIGVLIDEQGSVAVRAPGEAPTISSIARLPADLAKAGAGPHAWIVITGAPHTRYGAFMQVLDRLHGDGFTDVTLAAKGG